LWYKATIELLQAQLGEKERLMVEKERFMEKRIEEKERLMGEKERLMEKRIEEKGDQLGKMEAQMAALEVKEGRAVAALIDTRQQKVPAYAWGE
jgi:hypothetical protein